MNEQPPPLKRCAIYSRSSEEKDYRDPFDSVRAQFMACDGFIDSQVGPEIVRTDAVSGGYGTIENLPRPGSCRQAIAATSGLVRPPDGNENLPRELLTDLCKNLIAWDRFHFAGTQRFKSSLGNSSPFPVNFGVWRIESAEQGVYDERALYRFWLHPVRQEFVAGEPEPHKLVSRCPVLHTQYRLSPVAVWHIHDHSG